MFTVTENDKSFIIVIKILGIENSFSKLNLVAYCCNVLLSPQSTALKKNNIIMTNLHLCLMSVYLYILFN
jgi:hypothetical protein